MFFHLGFAIFVGVMKKIYKAHILFTKEKSRFEEFENGYIAVEDGIVKGVFNSLTELKEQSSLSSGQWGDVEVTDFGNCLLIPAMNDMHVHAPQVHNQGVAMDLELLPWLQNYTFPEEAKFADIHYAERMYRRFLHTQWLFGTMRSCVFGTLRYHPHREHTPADEAVPRGRHGRMGGQGGHEPQLP